MGEARPKYPERNQVHLWRAEKHGGDPSTDGFGHIVHGDDALTDADLADVSMRSVANDNNIEDETVRMVDLHKAFSKAVNSKDFTDALKGAAALDLIEDEYDMEGLLAVAEEKGWIKNENVAKVFDSWEALQEERSNSTSDETHESSLSESIGVGQARPGYSVGSRRARDFQGHDRQGNEHGYKGSPRRVIRSIAKNQHPKNVEA